MGLTGYILLFILAALAVTVWIIIRSARKRKWLPAVLAAVGFIVLAAAIWFGLLELIGRMGTTVEEDYFGFSQMDAALVEETDTHGGFHGDGFYYMILDCSENREQNLENVRDWEPLPLSENLRLILYGGERDGMTYGYHLAEDAHMPVIENGYYRFLDRHSESTDSSDDSELFDRASFNFSLAIYDSDTDRLYYLEFDT